MNKVRCITTALLLAGVATVSGCKAKQEAPAPKAAAPAQEAGEIKTISGQAASGLVTASAADKADAEAAAARVLAQMEAGEFAALYQESSPGFKQIGPEAAFVAKFQQTRQKTGPLKNRTKVSFVTRPDQAHVLLYRMENDRFATDRRLTFARLKDGKMVLEGLNQHDEPKHRP